MKKTILPLLAAVGLIGSASASVLTGDLTNGLVAYYQLNGNANDSSGNSNNLTQASDTSFTLGRFGNADGAVRLDSATAFLESMNPVGISGNASRTVSFWVKAANLGSDLVGWGAINDPPPGEGFLIQTTPDNGGQISVWGSYADIHSPDLGSQLSKWNQITYVYDGSVKQAQLFLNGYLIPSTQDGSVITTDLLNTADTTLRIGNRGSSFSLAVPDTSISDIGIWNTALTSNQVSQLYAAQSIPEPSTYALFGIGAIGMLMVMRRKKTA
jgi:hypothetical protein